MNCTIRIPEPTRHFSVYADGVVNSVVKLENESFVTFDDNYICALYYKIHGNRTVYLCISQNKMPEITNTIALAGVSRSLILLKALKGRAYDRYKRATDSIFKSAPEARKLPPLFFCQLSKLCEQKKNSMENLTRLLLLYGIRIRWKYARKNRK